MARALTDAQVEAIHRDPEKSPEVAARYGVSTALIRQIRGGFAYTHVPVPDDTPERRKLSPAIRAKILRKSRTMTLSGIAELLGINESSVRYVLEREGVARPDGRRREPVG